MTTRHQLLSSACLAALAALATRDFTRRRETWLAQAPDLQEAVTRIVANIVAVAELDNLVHARVWCMFRDVGE